jgi:hypothetical protein
MGFVPILPLSAAASIEGKIVISRVQAILV